MATLYFRSTGTNWGTAGDWSTTPSPAYVGGAVPTTADDVIFEAASANCIVNASNRVCKTINFTNYTNTITMSFNITVSGAITFGASMLVHASGLGAMICTTTSTITTNGFVWPNAFNFGVSGISQTYTLADNMSVNGLVTCVGTTALTINSAFTLTCNGGLVCTTTTSGTATIELKGGNWSGGCNNTLNLNSTGTITLNGNISRGSGTLTWVAGTINNSGSHSLSYGGGSINVGNNIIWNNITIGYGPLTLVNDLYCVGNLVTSNGCVLNGPAFKIYCTGINTTLMTTLSCTGTATVVLNGAGGNGNWLGGSNYWGISTIINCGANTLTIATGRIFGFNLVFTYTSGIVVCSGSANLNGGTYSTTGMSFNNVSFGTTGVSTVAVTLGNNMDIAGNLTVTSTAILTINNNQINLSGSFINNMTNISSGGTTIINMVGTGNIQTTGTGLGVWTNPITINSPSGTITWSGTNNYNGNLIYTAGTIVSTGSVLNRTSGTMTINNSGFNLGTLNLLGFTQFIGTSGFTIASLNCATAGVHTVWKAPNEYFITSAFNSGQADGNSRITYVSHNNAIFTATVSGFTLSVTGVTHGVIAPGSEIFAQGLTTGLTILPYGTAGTTGVGGAGTYYLSSSGGTVTPGRLFVASPGTVSYPKITLQQGATQNLYYTNAVDIDSNNGQTIWTFSGSLLRAANWSQLLPPKTKVVLRIN